MTSEESGDPGLGSVEAGGSPDALDGPRTAGLLVRGGALRLASYGGTMLLSVASMAALTRHLGRIDFRDYTTVMSVVTIVSTVTDSGMANIGTREYATLEGNTRERLLRNLLGLRITLSVVGVLVVVGWSLANGYRAALLLGAVGAGLATVALVIQHTLTIPLTATLRLGSLSALEFTRQAVTVAGILVLVGLGAGIFPLLAVTLPANALLIVPTWRLARGQISLRPSLHWAEWPPLLRATIVFSLATAVGTLYVYAAQVLTNFVMSPVQGGLFAVSFRVFVVAGSIPGLVVSAALPVLSRAARDDRDRLAYVMQRIFEATLITGIGAAIAVSAGASFIVTVVSGFHGAAAVLEIQAWALVATFVLGNWSYGMLSLRLHRGILAANLGSLVVSVVLTLVLGHAFGARGAAYATIAGESTLALASLMALVASRSGGRQYLPHLGILSKVLIAGALASVPAYVLDLPSVVRALLAALVYCVVILASGALPPEFRELLPTWIRR